MIGILGGTFDPPHIAHLKIAEYCVDFIPLEKIAFIPCCLPALKKFPHATAKHRLAMIEAAIKDNPKLTVDTREIKNEIKGEIKSSQPSYTIDTLKSIRQEIGDTTPLCFIMGSDAFNQFMQWKDWQGILKLTHITIINRPKYLLDLNKEPLLTQLLLKHQVSDPKELFKHAGGKILFCPAPPMNISSTNIREALQKNPETVKDKIPQAVWEYISKYGLYGITR